MTLHTRPPQSRGAELSAGIAVELKGWGAGKFEGGWELEGFRCHNEDKLTSFETLSHDDFLCPPSFEPDTEAHTLMRPLSRSVHPLAPE